MTRVICSKTFYPCIWIAISTLLLIVVILAGVTISRDGFNYIDVNWYGADWKEQIKHNDNITFFYAVLLLFIVFNLCAFFIANLAYEWIEIKDCRK